VARPANLRRTHPHCGRVKAARPRPPDAGAPSNCAPSRPPGCRRGAHALTRPGAVIRGPAARPPQVPPRRRGRRRDHRHEPGRIPFGEATQGRAPSGRALDRHAGPRRRRRTARPVPGPGRARGRHGSAARGAARARGRRRRPPPADSARPAAGSTAQRPPGYAPPESGREREVPLPETVAVASSEHIRRFPPVEITLPWVDRNGPPRPGRSCSPARRGCPHGRPGAATHRSRQVSSAQYRNIGLPATWRTFGR
jgi:hypothetical protein